LKDIKYNKVFSKWEQASHGVPQGSILGPLLFLIYINDLPFSLKNLAHPILFEDDTSIIISKLSPEEFNGNIISVFNERRMWFNRKFLTLSCDKSSYDFFKKSTEE
jgi:hypothetical protein